MKKSKKNNISIIFTKLLFFLSLGNNGFIRRWIRIIREFDKVNNKLFFDEEYYLANNPDVKASGMPSLKHYHLFGRFEGRKPNENERHMCYPAGHFYSPIVNIEEIKEREQEIWDEKSVMELPGIELNINYQFQLINEFSKFYKEIPFQEKKVNSYRYYFQNPAFSFSDGIILYSFIRHFSPSKIIEVGSGFSSALILDTIDQLKRTDVDVTFIEPYADLLFSLLSDKDKGKVLIIEKNLQQINLSFFKKLKKDDILFIDSSHVVKTGSDVNYLILNILPSLNKGVIIHFHDIFYPFEYPQNWVFEGRSWNEVYFLRSFLMFNNNFEIMLFPDFIHKNHKEYFSKMPYCFKNSGGSIWIRKVI